MRNMRKEKFANVRRSYTARRMSKRLNKSKTIGMDVNTKWPGFKSQKRKKRQRGRHYRQGRCKWVRKDILDVDRSTTEMESARDGDGWTSLAETCKRPYKKKGRSKAKKKIPFRISADLLGMVCARGSARPICKMRVSYVV